MFLRKHFLGRGPCSELEDVRENLAHVLGTKRGTGYFLPDFGLTELGYRTPEEMVVALSDELRQTLALYEPRVEVLEVEEDWDDLGKRTRLVVRLRVREASEPLSIVVDLQKRSLQVVAAELDLGGAGGPGA